MTFLLLFLFTRPPRRSLQRQLSSRDLHQRRKPGEISNIFMLILVECFFFFKQKITGFQYIAQWSPHPKTSRGLSLASLRSLTGEDDLLGSFRDSLTPKVFFAQDFERHTLVDHKPLVLCSRGNSTSGLFSICIYKTLYLQI